MTAGGEHGVTVPAVGASEGTPPHPQRNLFGVLGYRTVTASPAMCSRGAFRGKCAFDTVHPESVSTKGTNPDEAAWAAALKHEPKYQRRLREYADTVGVKERGLKKWIEKARLNWIAAGCPAGGPAFPPLDDPAKLLEWRMAHMSNASAKTHAAAASASSAAPGATPPPAGAAPGDAPPPPPPQTRAPIDLANTPRTTFRDAVANQERRVTAINAAYEKALASGTATTAELALLSKELDSAVTTLRQCQTELNKADLELGDRPHLSDIRATLAPLLHDLGVNLLEFLVERIGLPRARARELTDELFRDLHAHQFAQIPRAGAPADAA